MRTCAWLAGLSIVGASVFAGPPPTPAKPVELKFHGETFVDKYLWLEGDNADPAQMGRMTPEVDAWTIAQNEFTRASLDNLPGRKEIEAAILPLMEVGSISAPTMRGDRYFYTERTGKQNQPKVYVREGYKGTPKLLLDPETIDASGLVTIAWYSPSEDGRLLAYGTYRAGDENATLRLLDVDSGTVLPLVIEGKVGGADWLPDGSGFVYRNLADIKNPYSGQVKFHKMGTAVDEDPILFRQYTKEENAQLATTYGPFGYTSRDGRWLILGYYTDTRNNDLWAVDFEEYRKSGKLDKVEINVGDLSQNAGTVVGDTLYLQTTNNAANGRIVAVDLKNPSKGNWKELVAERKDAVIAGTSVAKDALIVDYITKAYTVIERFDLDGKPRGELKLPGIGSAGIVTEIDRSEAFVTYTSYNHPSSIFRIDLAKSDEPMELWAQPDVPVDPNTVEVKQEWYASKDGTKVSMFVIHKKGLKLDGNNPTILYGYGGFNVSMQPTFSAPLFQWFDAGGVYAVANLRGGGEYGKEWHEAGRLDRKQNVFNDFIAAAEHLIKSGYTKPARLAVVGGSNGGLLTGAFVTQRPDLCAAAIVAVPLLDMLRFQDFLMARYWIPEYGSAEDAAQYQFIRAYSPYHNIKAGTPYPACLITAGENDSRVHPMHARKMVAALREATKSDAGEILLWVDRDAGHGQGKPLNLRLRDAVDQRIFIMWQLGMLSKS